jgi:hypothetical protein
MTIDREANKVEITYIILLYVEPLLCDDREIGEYTRGNGSVNTFPQQRIDVQHTGADGNGVFLRGSCREIILKTVGATKSVLYGSL